MLAGLDTDEGPARDYKWKPIPVSPNYARFAERSRARYDLLKYTRVCIMQSLEDSPREIFQKLGKRMRMARK